MKNLKDNEINAIFGGWVGVAKSILDWGVEP